VFWDHSDGRGRCACLRLLDFVLFFLMHVPRDDKVSVRTSTEDVFDGESDVPVIPPEQCQHCLSVKASDLTDAQDADELLIGKGRGKEGARGRDRRLGSNGYSTRPARGS